MKMFKKYIFVALAAVLSLAACTDEDNSYVVGEQDSADKAGVYFPSINPASTELSPEDETTVTYVVARKNKSGQITVPINVDSNDDNVFNVPSSVTFADGDSVADLKVTFPTAAVGTTYSFTVSVPDEYVATYKSYDGVNHGYSFTSSIVRVKWNDLGTVQLYDGFWYGVLLDDVKLQQRDDNKKVYRIENPFTDDLVTSLGETPSGYYSEYFSFTVNNSGYISWSNYFPYNTYNTDYGAAMLGWYPSTLNSSLASNDAQSHIVTDDDGNIIYFNLAPYWYMSGVGGYGCYSIIIGAPGVDLTEYLQ